MRKRVGRETNESDREKVENEETKPYEGKYSSETENLWLRVLDGAGL